MGACLTSDPVHLVACPACHGSGRLLDADGTCTLCHGSGTMELIERCFIRSIVETERHNTFMLKTVRQRHMIGQPFRPCCPDDMELMQGACCGTCRHTRYPEYNLEGSACLATGQALDSSLLWFFGAGGIPYCTGYQRSTEYDWEIDFSEGYKQSLDCNTTCEMEDEDE